MLDDQAEAAVVALVEHVIQHHPHGVGAVALPQYLAPPMPIPDQRIPGSASTNRT